jgi:hypothetical protein
MKRFYLTLICLLIAGSLVGGAYLLVKRFQRDRQEALGFRPADDRHPFETGTTSDGKTTHTYTTEELEEARRTGKLPKSADPKGVSSAEAANQAAVQRSLKTIEEINRINAMNQRLIEQQQRIQR